jgi:hypothetical protein
MRINTMSGAFDQLNASRALALAVFIAAIAARGSDSVMVRASDLSIIPLFDGERSEPLNTWGGAWGRGTMAQLEIQSQCVHGGRYALAAELGPLGAGQSRYLQCFASGFGQRESYYQTRDLTRYRRLEFYARNATEAPLHCWLQIKDYRDSLAHRATYLFDLPAGADWTPIQVPLVLEKAGWKLDGLPDLSRVLTIDLFVQPQTRLLGGRLYLDDVVLVEPDGPTDVDSCPLAVLVERLAHRQWDALWAARSREHGMIHIHSYQSTDAGLNTTAAVLWMLPSAVRRGWLDQEEADAYVAQLTETINRLLDGAKHLPPRNVDWVSLQPSLVPEESSVDSAFLALALHQYKSLPSTLPALREAIDQAQQRFDFASFVGPAGWCMAYRYATPHGKGGFVDLTYNGYTNEGRVVSLAAHLSRRHHVPIETCWNADIHRIRARLAGGEPPPVVHTIGEFRAPFTQALLNLFVDVRGRGTDGYPDHRLAANPWQNFVDYERGVMNRLAARQRPYLVQPDAGDDGTLSNYQQFSLYEDFGQSDLFMPWSSAFVLMAGADGSEQALRFLLRHRLHGPLGLADSARWTTGAPEPSAVTARHDFWNTALSTMAFLEWLDGEMRLSQSFAALPEVRAALDQVFLAKPERNAAQQQVARLRPE